jgi:hypothetical protein
MQDSRGTERRVIFRPYSLGSKLENVYICVGCGMKFSRQTDMAEMSMRFAEHLCDPVFLERSGVNQDSLNH